MNLKHMYDPSRGLQHPAGLEGINSEAPNVHKKKYFIKEARQVPSIEACHVLLTKHCQSFDSHQAERLAGALYVLEGLPPAERSAVAAFVLDATGAGFPEVPGFGDIRETAELWADCASHVEPECYTLEGLRWIARTPLALCQQKRLLVTLWDTLADDDRRAFLSWVDPVGRFQGRAA